MNTLDAIPSIREVFTSKPVVILFQSVEGLGITQGKIADLVNNDVPILVCSSIADKARARELGADYCLIHCLTYENFVKAVSTIQTSTFNQPRLLDC